MTSANQPEKRQTVGKGYSNFNKSYKEGFRSLPMREVKLKPQ